MESEKAASFSFPLKLGHWNVRWFPGGHPTRSTLQTAETQRLGVLHLLKSEQPDLLFMCEVRTLSDLKPFQKNYPYITCTNIPRTEAEDPSLPQQSLALLSRYAWKDSWALDFSQIPETPDKPSRGILGAQFESSSGRRLALYGVHLKSNRGDATSNFLRRRKALEYLEADWRKHGWDPAKDEIVILGDFNTSPDDPAFSEETTLKRLHELGFLNTAAGLPPGERATIPADGRFPANNFDHIYLSPALAARQDSAFPTFHIVPIDTRTVSDHFPIFIQLR